MNCPNCGKEAGAGEKFCTGCGTKLSENAGGMPTGSGNNESFSNMPANNADSSPFDSMSAGNVNNSPFNSIPTNNAMSNGVLDWLKNLLFGITGKGVNLKVRRYFFGFGDIVLLAFILWIFSGYKLFTMNAYSSPVLRYLFCGITTIALIVMICIDIYSKIIGIGKEAVDKAIQSSIKKLENRAHTKFNVDASQISEVEPIVASGTGISPLVLDGIKSRHFIKLARLRTQDPIEACRIGTDRLFRSLLVQTTVYAFTDTQLLIYSGNIDIATGIIYDETVSEIFYKDINSVAKRDSLRKFKAGIFKKEYYTLKYLYLDICGVSKIASFDSRLAPGVEASLIGMESYIREKKF